MPDSDLDRRSLAGRTLPLDLPDLYQLFDETPPAAALVQHHEVPQPYRELLAHEAHMTVTLESHWNTKVTLEVLEGRRSDPLYARRILLRHGDTGVVVQYGIMQFDFRHCSTAVKNEILAEHRPLGRILIENQLLRRISTHAILEIEASSEMASAFNESGAEPRVQPGDPVWGRLATIFVNEQPAVALLEVVRPE